MISLHVALIGDYEMGIQTPLKYFLQLKPPRSTYFPTYNHTVEVDYNLYKLKIHDATRLEYKDYQLVDLKNIDVVILMVSISDPLSYEEILRKWIQITKYLWPNAPIILVGCTIILSEESGQKYDRSEFKYLALRINATEYLECKIQSRPNAYSDLKELLEKVVRASLHHHEKVNQKSIRARLALNLVVVGSRYSGKIDLIEAFKAASTGNTLRYHHPSANDLYSTITIDGKNFDLNILDFLESIDISNSEKWAVSYQNSYRYANADMTALVVLFSVENPHSYDVITPELVEEVKKYHQSDVSPAVILVGTDTEKRKNRCSLSEQFRPPITEEMGQQLASKINAVYMELSSWDDDDNDGKKRLLEEIVFTSIRHDSNQ